MKYSYQDLKNDVKFLSASLLSADRDKSVIVGVSRGGLIPGVMLSQLTDIEFVPLRWSNNGRTYDRELLLGLYSSYHKLYVVDDICDTGDTLNSLLGAVRVSFGSTSNITTMCLINNVRALHVPDIYARVIDRMVEQRYVLFPWEQL